MLVATYIAKASRVNSSNPVEQLDRTAVDGLIELEVNAHTCPGRSARTLARRATHALSVRPVESVSLAI
jgi:hypothetical protein